MPRRRSRANANFINDGLKFANNPVTSLTMREMMFSKRLVIFVAVLIGIGALMTMLGPFGTYSDLGLLPRLAYWVSITVAGGLQSNAAIVIASKVLPLPRWPLAAVVVSGSAVASLLGTFEVIGLEALFRPGNNNITGFAELYLAVLLLTVIISSVFAGPFRHFTLTPKLFRYDDPPTAEIPFLKRIPTSLGRDLLCLEMEDHYVRIHTSLGDDLILMRLRDAVVELEGYDGIQVHRSFWVARSAIVQAERKGDGAVLTLSNAMRIPVSRNRMGDLREQGLF